MGRFRVVVDGAEVPVQAWGSRRALQLLKRIALAAGGPVTRDELTELLWPDETDIARLGARLSVLLSTVRRVVRVGIVADRDAVRLDPEQVDVDLVHVLGHLANGDDEAAVRAYRGELLPEDQYEDWARQPAERLRLAMVEAHRRIGVIAAAADDHDKAAGHADAALALDPYDERAHELLVRSLLAAGRRSDAALAAARYERAAEQLGIAALPLLQHRRAPAF